MDSASPKISVEHKDGIAIVSLTDEKILEDIEINYIEQSIMPVVQDSKTGKLIICFENVKFLSSAALGLLIRISKKINEKDGELRLCCIDSKIMNVFKITRLDKVFEICKTSQKAIDSLS